MIKCTKFAAASVALSTVLTAWSHSAQASDIQPFACKSSTAEVVNERDNFVKIGRSDQSIKLVNKSRNDCGFVVFNIPEKSLLSDASALDNLRPPRVNNALRIVVKGDNSDIIKDIVVRMCFKPQLGLPDLISVDKPLSEFKAEGYLDQHIILFARRNELFGNREGVPDLRRLTVILTRPGTVTLGGIAWGAMVGGGPRIDTFEPTNIVLENAGCDAGKACSKSTLLRSRISELRDRLSRLRNR